MTLPLASARKAIPAYIILRMPPRNSALFTPNPIPRLLVGLRLDGAAAFTRFAHFRSATMLPNDFACPAAHTLGRAVRWRTPRTVRCYQAQPSIRELLYKKSHERMHTRGPQVKVALGRFSPIVDDGDRKLSQRRVGLLFFLKCGVKKLYCPVYAQLTGPSLQCAVA
jgi:hypothetical protein